MGCAVILHISPKLSTDAVRLFVAFVSCLYPVVTLNSVYSVCLISQLCEIDEKQYIIGPLKSVDHFSSVWNVKLKLHIASLNR